MKEKIKEYCDNPNLILVAVVIGAIAGGILGVFAYLGKWLG